MDMAPTRRRRDTALARFQDEVSNLFGRSFEGPDWPFGEPGYCPALDVTDRDDAEKIEAKHLDGVLTITLPKTEKAKPRKIRVKGQ